MTALLVALTLAQLDGGTVVVAPRPREAGVTTVRGGELSTPERDAARAFQQLAGVARSALGSADVVVWGAAPQDSRFLIDGIEVPTVLHAGGYRGVLASPLVGRLELTAAAFRGELGRSLGATLRLDTAELPSGVHGAVSVDLTNASALIAGGTERSRFALAGDVGLLRPLVQPLLQRAAADRYALPISGDAQAKASFIVGEQDVIEVLALGSSDVVTQQLGSNDSRRGREQTLQFLRLGTTWRHGGSAEGATVTPFIGVDRRVTTLQGTAGQAAITEAVLRGGLRARTRTALSNTVAIAAGVDGLISRGEFSRSGPPTFPPREGDVSAFGQPISDDAALDRWRATVTDVAAFTSVELSLGPLSLTPAVRLSAVAVDVSRSTPNVAATPPLGRSSLEFLLEPRVSATWNLTPALSLLGGAGLTHQAPDGADLSAVFGSPSLTTARGAHAALGASITAPWVSVDATAFWRGSTGLPVRETRAIPGLAAALVPTGEGRAYGAQLSLRQRPYRGLSSTLAWTLGRSERRDDPTGAWRVSDFDQTHTLIASVTQQFAAWRFGLRGRFATGAPRTEVVGRYIDLRRGVNVPIFGAPNGTRLPDFVQLDVDAAHTFAFASGSLEVFVLVLNVTNQRNVEEYVYDSTFSTRAGLLGLPLCATVGVRGSW